MAANSEMRLQYLCVQLSHHPAIVMTKKANQILIQVMKMSTVRKMDMITELMTSHTMKKKFTVWKKIIIKCFKGCFLPRFAQFYKQSQTKPTENMIQIMTLDWMCYASKKSKITRRI